MVSMSILGENFIQLSSNSPPPLSVGVAAESNSDGPSPPPPRTAEAFELQHIRCPVSHSSVVMGHTTNATLGCNMSVGGGNEASTSSFCRNESNLLPLLHPLPHHHFLRPPPLPHRHRRTILCVHRSDECEGALCACRRFCEGFLRNTHAVFAAASTTATTTTPTAADDSLRETAACFVDSCRGSTSTDVDAVIDLHLHLNHNKRAAGDSEEGSTLTNFTTMKEYVNQHVSYLRKYVSFPYLIICVEEEEQQEEGRGKSSGDDGGSTNGGGGDEVLCLTSYDTEDFECTALQHGEYAIRWGSVCVNVFGRMLNKIFIPIVFAHSLYLFQ